MGKLTKRSDRGAGAERNRLHRLGQRRPRLRRPGDAVGPQELRSAVSRRPTVAADGAGLRQRRHAGAGAHDGDPAPRRAAPGRRSAGRARRRPRRGDGEGSRRPVRCRAHRRAPEALDAEGVPAKPQEVHPALLRQPADRRGQPRGGRPLPSQVPARALPGQPLPGDPLEDVQSRRAVGLAAGRLQPAQAHQEVPRGEARAVPERRRAAARRRGARRDGGRRAGDAVGDRRGAAAHSHRLPAERDHDAEVELRRPRRRRR